MLTPKFFFYLFVINSFVAVTLGAYFYTSGLKLPALFIGGMVNLLLALAIYLRGRLQAK